MASDGVREVLPTPRASQRAVVMFRAEPPGFVASDCQGPSGLSASFCSIVTASLTGWLGLGAFRALARHILSFLAFFLF